MIVHFAPRAVRDVERIDVWWREHRAAAPELFAHELRAAISLLENFPKVGVVYEPRRELGIRKLLLERTKYHVYFREIAGTEIEIITVWSAFRGRGPRL